MRPLSFSRRLFLLLLVCSSVSPAQEFILLGWSTSGMQATTKDFSKFALQPPGVTLRAVLLHRGFGWPWRVTQGYSVEYSIPNNGTSVTKTNFWSYAQTLFKLDQPLSPDVGLTGAGLSGQMDTCGKFFEISGIPATPYPDSSSVTEVPYQFAHLTAREVSTGKIIATTDVVIPVSNEMNCVRSGCHGSAQSLLNKHAPVTGFDRFGPVLCASCHSSNLTTVPDAVPGGPLSLRIHRRHQTLAGAPGAIETCYMCHPGARTQFFRDTMRYGTAALVCQDCHGSMESIATSIDQGRRPWADEPRCGGCHGPVFSEPPGTLYRDALGHGRLPCSSCHGSPHAILPSIQPNDNTQSIRLQGFAGPIRECRICHMYSPPIGGPHGLTLTSIREEEDAEPGTVQLRQNYPNPFNGSTIIPVDIPVPSVIEAVVFASTGQRVRTLSKRSYPQGSALLVWDGTDDSGKSVASGIYICRLLTTHPSGDRRNLAIQMVYLR